MKKDINSDDAYEASLDYLYNLINFEVRRHDRYMASKLDSTRPGRLMKLLGSPHDQYPTIHIAGTKGKGSVAAMCAASLQAAGLKVGLFTSPHVCDFRERIRVLTLIDTVGLIPKTNFTTLMNQLRPIIENDLPDITWFEVVTAIAFLYFAQQKVDVAVVEVGLGGRLDATNVLLPLVSVITSLSYDHTEFLGDTLTEIAGEKGGIIKYGIPVISAPQRPEALARLVEIAEEKNSPFYLIGRDWIFEGRRDKGIDGKQTLIILQAKDSAFVSPGESFDMALSGSHQLDNATVALAALSLVRSHFPNLTLTAIKNGLENVSWIGRLQVIHQGAGSPTILVDCAHNVDSASKLCHALTHDYTYRRLWLVIGATVGKDVIGMMSQLLPLAEGTIATISTHPRALAPEELVRLAKQLGYSIIKSPLVAEGLIKAWELAGPNDLICVTGSIFVVGDLLNEWENIRSRFNVKPTIPQLLE